MKKEEKKKSEKNNIIKLPDSLATFGNFKRISRSRRILIFPNHVQSDNEDFVCASGWLFAICTCPPI
jgi:hypothetical protein